MLIDSNQRPAVDLIVYLLNEIVFDIHNPVVSHIISLVIMIVL